MSMLTNTTVVVNLFQVGNFDFVPAKWQFFAIFLDFKTEGGKTGNSDVYAYIWYSIPEPDIQKSLQRRHGGWDAGYEWMDDEWVWSKVFTCAPKPRRRGVLIMVMGWKLASWQWNVWLLCLLTVQKWSKLLRHYWIYLLFLACWWSWHQADAPRWWLIFLEMLLNLL